MSAQDQISKISTEAFSPGRKDWGESRDTTIAQVTLRLTALQHQFV